MKLINPFECRDDLISLKRPIIRMVICILIIIFLIERDRFIRIEIQFPSIVVQKVFTIILLLPITAVTIYSFYAAVGEFCYTYENRRKQICRAREAKLMAVSEILELSANNEIIEFVVCVNKKLISIGASSDCRRTGFVFENKQYYIANTEYNSVELFSKALNELFPDGSVLVHRIDGLLLKD